MPTLITVPPGIINGRRIFDQVASPINQNRGDIWRERNASSDLVLEWFWNGTYWLSKKTHYIRYGGHGNGATFSKYEPLETEFPQYNFYCLAWNVAARIDTTNNPTNYWNFEIYRRSSTLAVTNISSVSTSSWSSGSVIVRKEPVNTHLNVMGGLDAKFFWIYAVKIGSPGIVDPLSTALAYKFARP